MKMYKAAAVAAGAALISPLQMSRVYAKEEPAKAAESPEKEKSPAAPKDSKPSSPPAPKPQKSNKIPVNQLPIYSGPRAAELLYIAEEPEAIREHVTVFRKAVQGQLEKCQGAVSTVRDTYKTTQQYSREFIQYLREDAGALPRAAFITVSGLGGIIAGYKGGIFRKTFYAGSGMTAAAAICYPNQAVDITRRGFVLTKEQATQLWGQMTGSDSKSPKPIETPKKTQDEKTEKKEEESPATNTSETKETKDKVKVVTDAKDSAPAKDPAKDFGMSKKEDKDMYSTRSS